MKENYSSEIPLLLFVNMKEDLLLSVKQIKYYEVLCLKSINYNIFSHSAYDWIIQLIGIGIVFDCEIEEKNAIIFINGHRHSIVKAINKYSLKMLLDITQKITFVKYSPMIIAFSIIQISREKFLNSKLINSHLFNKLINLYGIDFNDYKKCYEEIKSTDIDNIIEKEKDNKEEKIFDYQNKNNDQNKLKKKISKQYSIENTHLPNNIFKNGKNFILKNINQKEKFLFENNNNQKAYNFIANKLNEKKSIISIKKTIIENKEKYENIIDKKISLIDKNIKLSNVKPKNVKILTITSKTKASESYDNLPLINLRIETKIDPINKNSRLKLMKSSTELIKIDYNSATKMTNTKENKFNHNLSNLSNNNIKINKIDEPLNKLDPIRKTIFKLGEKAPIKRKSLDKIKIFQFKKATNSLPFNEKIKEIKTNNNIELIKKNIDKISFKLKKNINYRLGKFIRMPS